MASYSCFYWKKYDCTKGTKVGSGCLYNMPHTRHRLMSCHWSCDPRWVKISGHSESEQLGPCGSTSLASWQHLGRFCVHVCSLFVCNWWAKFKQNIIVLCIFHHNMVAIMMSNPGFSTKFDVDPLSNSDSKRSNNLFRAGGWSLSPDLHGERF